VRWGNLERKKKEKGGKIKRKGKKDGKNEG
jgi:hypothetical protein